VRYLLMIYEDEEAFANAPPEIRDGLYAGHRELMQELADAGKDVRGAELQLSDTAVTLRGGSSANAQNGRLRTDGPFTESAEALGGYYVVDCADVDEAIAWAERIPTLGGGIEIRPLVET
jgi:hypothetical protein